MALLLRLMVIVLLSQIQPGFAGLASLAGIFADSKLSMKMIIGVSEKTVTGFDLFGHVEGLTEDPNDLIMEQLDEIMGAIEEVANTLERFETRLDQKLDSMMDTMVDRIVSNFEKSIALRDFQKVIRNINHLWNSFNDIKNNSKINERTIRQFINVAIGIEEYHLSGWLNTMSSLINKDSVSTMTPTVFDAMQKYHEAYAIKTCGEGVSPQQEINHFFGILLMAEFRALSMAMYGYLKEATLTKVSYAEEVNLFKNDSLVRIRSYYRSTKAALSKASTMIRACDPDNFIKEKSYAEMEQAFQSVLVHEDEWLRDMYYNLTAVLPAKYWPLYKFNCQGDCKDLGSAKTRNSSAPCQGHLYNCRGEGDEITFCPADKSSSRRYEWFQEGEISDRKCSTKVEMKTWRSGPQFYPCEPCICDCAADLNGTKPRAIISLLPAKSHIDQNMVVTGVKIVYKNNTIKLQVREGHLGPYGSITVNNITKKGWVPAKKLKLLPHKERPAKKNRRELKEDEGYIYLSRRWQTIILSDISVPKDYVVAGVKFSPRADNTSSRYIDLQVLGVQFNYSTGEVKAETRRWFKSNVATVPIKFENPDIPLKHKFNIPRLERNLRVDFQPSGEIDSGQTTIPFWDIQEVVTTPPAALQGVGLLHKGHEFGKYGGYIALRLSTFDYQLYFR